MHLVHNWRAIVRRAWSVRLMALAVLLTGCEVAMPFWSDSLPRGPFAVLSFMVILGALAARIVAQRNLP